MKLQRRRLRPATFNHLIDQGTEVFGEIFHVSHAGPDYGSLLGLRHWWRSQDAELGTDMQVGDVYQLVHRTAVEAEAAWSLLPVRSDGTRILTTTVALLPIALQLIERHGDIVVWDIGI
jgi:hypothetical protein